MIFDAEEARIQDLIEKIKASIAQQQAAAFGTCMLVAEAKKLDPGQYEHVVKQAGLRSVSNADNYARVGNAEHLRMPDIQPHLPMSLGALIDLAAVPEEDIRKGIGEEVIHPHATRAEIALWRNDYLGKDKKKKRGGQAKKTPEPDLGLKLGFTVYVPGDWTIDDIEAVEDMLTYFRRRGDPDDIIDDSEPGPVRTMKPKNLIAPERKYEKAMGRWARKVDAHIIKGARKIVRDAKKAKGKQWAFYWDEVDIPPDADEQRIRDVLDTIGRPDVFESLRDAAYQAVEQPGFGPVVSRCARLRSSQQCLTKPQRTRPTRPNC
jgi:hypothetical protein